MGSLEASSCSLFRDCPLELSSDVTLILVLPPPGRLCAPLESDLPLPSEAFSTTPLQLFEQFSGLQYRPSLCRPLSSLAALLDLLEPALRQQQREAFSEAEVEAARTHLDAARRLSEEVEAARREHRWAAEVVSRARERKEDSGADMAALGRALEEPRPPERPLPTVSVTPAASGKLRIHAEYRTGLAPGTSVLLFLTQRTTAREIVELVVRQLNKAALVRDSLAPQYGPEERVGAFQLVAVLPPGEGRAQEMALPDGFHPLRLPEPFAHAKLVIRERTRSAASSRLTSRAGSPCPTCSESLVTDV